ncbi:MAG: glycosyltransferase family 39 protein [Phycisphaerales bacterium]|nr:glycosyltransferase family 39 protein [Phycisphaerales bacterium]MCB9862297.1 glycosyltransferase family 39 protein [Phycisphaerales bacterium]
MAEKAAEMLADAVRARRMSRWAHACAVVLIGLAVGVIGGRGITQGGVGWSDGANHFFDGVFVYEFVRDWPVNAPRAWAEQFYLRHPSLGIVVYWPPGFAAVEAAVFGVFGVSLVAARVLVLAFAFGAAYLLFRLVRDLWGDGIGLMAALLLVTCPFGELWMTDIMLEWPATFWILLAAWAYVRGAGGAARRRTALWSILCGVSMAAAFLTKQTAGFIWPVIVIHAVLSRAGRRWLLRRATIFGFGFAALVVVAYGRLSEPYAGLASELLQLDVDALWYARHAEEIFGWGILAAAGIGVVSRLCILATRAGGLSNFGQSEGVAATPACSLTVAVRNGVTPGGALRPAWLFAIWFVSWYAFSSAIEAKEPRYLFFALPPFVVLAAFGIAALGRIGARERGVAWRVGLLAGLLVIGNCVYAVASSRGRLPSYAPAVELLVERGDADLVLVDAVRDGQFVLDVYENDAARGRIIPLRASKLLYARAARMKYGGELLVESEAEIVALLDQLGVRYVVMESRSPRTQDATIDPAPRKLLRSLVSDASRFALRGQWPLACDDPDWDDVSLRVYEYLACPPRSTNRVRISVPAMGRDVEIELPG